MDRMVIDIQSGLDECGIKLGRRIGIDATPLEAMFNDEDAKYNGHYEISGYKIHGVYDLDYEIPLAIIITTAEKGDSPIFRELLKRVHDKLGINFEEVYADGAYNGFENFALVHMTYNAKLYTNIDKDSVYREDGTEKGIQYAYNRLRNKPDFQPPDNLTLKDKMEFLMKYGVYDPIGAYYRNIHMREWEQWKQDKEENGDKIPYHLRNLTEGFHGYVKKYLNLQVYLDYRGIRNAERHIRWSFLAILGIVLTRVQNGIVDDLIQIAYFG